MRRAGFGYANPLEANRNPVFRTEYPSQQEIATATADARCKREINLITTWARVETAYQQHALRNHAEQLEIIKNQLEKKLENATRITAGH